MKNLKDLITDIETFCTAHYLINTFKYGDVASLNKDKEFKPVQVEVFPTTITNSGKLRDLNLDIYVLDKCKEDGSNLLEIHDKTLQVANDLVNTFIHGDDSLIQVRNEFTIEATDFTLVYNERNNRLTGWQVGFTVNQFNKQDGCNVPI